MTYNYSKLLGKITEKFGNNKNFAAALGVSERTLSVKLSSKVDFKQQEIIKICKLLDLPENEIKNYFFVKKVQ